MTGGKTTTRSIEESHGKYSTYNMGCRCAPCKAAKSAYQRAAYLRKKAARS